MVDIYPSAIHMVIGGGIPSELCKSMGQSAGQWVVNQCNGDNEGNRTGKGPQALAQFMTTIFDSSRMGRASTTRGVGNVERGQAKKG